VSKHHPPHSHHHRHPPYPRQFLRFDGLQGGQYGFLVLTANSDDALDIQLGADFVRLTRAQVADLGCAATAFLDLEEDERSERPVRREPRSEPRRETLVQEVVEIAEELMTTERSPSSPPPSHLPRRRGRARPT
jgi:hypothetical protein